MGSTVWSASGLLFYSRGPPCHSPPPKWPILCRVGR